ncbi:hypothetical protein [Brevibacterium yomogidense]|uniref:hypothetical protein n=1 Tax=Brevibacterium yomogidense TaxID=946573 RepID=UPI0018E00621
MDTLFTFAESFPTALQWLAVMLIGAIPFVESYGGAVLGVLTGVPAPVAILAAIIGNVAAMALTVWIAGAVREKAVAKRRARASVPSDATIRVDAAGEPGDADQAAPSKGKQRLRRMFDRYGVPGVSILGQSVLPSHITAPTLVGFGASRGSVIVWQTVGIIAWGVLFGVLASAGITLAMR